MAKITLDPRQIPGFDGLPDEVRTRLTGLELEAPDPDYSGYVTKAVFDKKASEAAELSKKLRSRMTEEEQQRAADAEAMAALRAELDTLRREKTVSDYTAQFAALGYDESLAAATAAALADGDMAAVFAAQKQHQAAAEQRLKADLLFDTPKPAPGAGGGPLSKKDFLTMSTEAQTAYIKDNPDWMSTLT